MRSALKKPFPLSRLCQASRQNLNPKSSLGDRERKDHLPVRLLSSPGIAPMFAHVGGGVGPADGAGREVRLCVRQKSHYWKGGFHTTTCDPTEPVKNIKTRHAKMKELFFKGKELDDNRSLAFYNVNEGDVIESCSNPLWLALLYITVEGYKRDVSSPALRSMGVYMGPK